MRLDLEARGALTKAITSVITEAQKIQALVDGATIITDQPDPPPPSPGLTPPDLPYSPQAVWNKPIGNSSPDPMSGTIVAAVAAKATDSQVHLVEYTARNVGHARTYQAVIGGGLRTFRGPDVLERGDAPDFAMVVIDDERLTAARFYQPSTPSSNGLITATGAGLFDISTANVNGRSTYGGGTGWGLSSDIGLLTVDDVERGEVQHALRFHLNVGLFSGRVRPPAIKTDPTPAGGWTGPVDYASRFQLDPSLDYRDYQPASWNSGWRRLHQVIFTGLQTYGAIVTDRTGAGVVVAIEKSGRWRELVGAPASTGNYNPVLRGGAIPWNRMRVLAP